MFILFYNIFDPILGATHNPGDETMSSSENSSDDATGSIVIARDSSDCVSESCPSGTFSWTPTAPGQEILQNLPDEVREHVTHMLTALAHSTTIALGTLVKLANIGEDAFNEGAEVLGITQMLAAAKLMELSGGALPNVTIAMIDLDAIEDIGEDDDPEDIIRKLGL